MVRSGSTFALTLSVLSGIALTSWADSVFIPNASFEAPATEFAGPEMAGWRKAPEPLWYNAGGGGFPWEQLMGQFLNPAAGENGHVGNLDGRQAAFLFALPDVAIFQDYTVLSAGESGPRPDFQAQFEAGKSYALTVGVLGGGGGMETGAKVELALYYRNAAGQQVTVASTVVTNSPAQFPTNSAFIDFQVRLPRVRPDDAWAGKLIGVRIASLVGFDDMGGYWDVDDLRLSSSTALNESFESPAVDFADPAMDGWRKSPQPPWYDPAGGFAWEQLTGQFANPVVGEPGHLANIDGRQAAFLFALPEVAISQDAASLDGAGGLPARFRPGHTYTLTAGVLGGGGGMVDGVILALRLYYTNAAGGRVTVATTMITNQSGLFPTNTQLVDFQVRVPRVEAADSWAGHPIGIEVASMVGFDRLGGYWDIDNIRLCENAVANPSFESPSTEFADPRMDHWQKSPQPFWYDPSGGFAWEQLTGQFQNSPVEEPTHIDNLDGGQAAFLFALPDVALFQDAITLGSAAVARFEPGRGYNLTVGVLGGGGNMKPGVTLALRVYYRDAAGNRVPVATTTVTNSPAQFPDPTRLTDFNVVVPVVRPQSPWAGRPLGVELLSTAGFDNLGGYWDLDNVRLTEVRVPWLRAPAAIPDGVQITLDSSPGRYEVLTSPVADAPTAEWTSWRTMTNVTGNMIFDDTTGGGVRRFYQARPTP